MKKILIKILTKLRMIWLRFIKKRILKNLMRKYPNSCIIVDPFCSIGDTCIVLTYLVALKVKLRKRIVLIVAENLKNIIQVYGGYDEVLYIPRKKIMQFDKCYVGGRFGWRWYENMKNLGKLMIPVYGYFRDELRKLHSLSALDIMRDVVYEIPLTSTMQFPKLDLDLSDESLKCILINPFSDSMKIPLEYFSCVIDYFISLGYKVYTNCKNDNSFCFEKTTRFVSSVIDLYRKSKTFEYIISARSGILDFLVSTGVKEIAFYYGKKGKDNRHVYSIKNWGNVDCLELFPEECDYMQEIKTFVESHI